MLFTSVACVVVAFLAHACTGDLAVTLVPVQGRKANAQQLEVHYTNTNPTAMGVYNWMVPVNKDELDEDAFDIRCNGKPAPYIGRIVKRKEPTVRDLIRIEAGKTVAAKITLTKSYDMSDPCDYKIQFNAPTQKLTLQEMRSGATSKTTGDNVKSNTVSLFAAGVPSSKTIAAPAIPSRKGLSFSSCSSTQQRAGSAGLSAAQNYATTSMSWLNSPPSSKARFTTWFGAWTSSSWSLIRSHFTNVNSALQTANIVFDCSCVTDPSMTNTYAYVYPTQPYRIYLCVEYFNAPVTGYNSQGGTIIHESTHFNVVAGTRDNQYGGPGCQNLAKTNPTSAMNNADSHEFFAENANPKLP